MSSTRGGGGRPTDPGAAAPFVPLPGNLGHPREAARVVFDRLAATYDRARPGYPPDAVKDLVSLCRLTESSTLLEVGCGTGQLTRDLAANGWRIRCLEPGPSLAELARANLGRFPNVSVIEAAFEDVHEDPASYDAIVAATSFHWVDPEVGLPKAAELLRPGGALALLSNSHAAGGTQDQISEEARRLHQRLAPQLGGWQFPAPEAIARNACGGGDIGAVWNRVDRKFSDSPSVDHLFDAPTVCVYPWLASYSSEYYAAMLSTQAPYALLDPGSRDAVLDAMANLVTERLGGTVTKQYVTVLAVTPRRAL
jgi:SAM-dependent methyltransferase